MKLPKPTKEFGKYLLEDGSIIYPSGGDYATNSGDNIKMPDAGKWMLWRKTGENRIHGRMVATGEIIMDRFGPKYFLSPIAALIHLEGLPEKLRGTGEPQIVV